MNTHFETVVFNMVSIEYPIVGTAKPRAKITLRAGNLIRTWSADMAEPMISLLENMIDSIFSAKDENLPEIIELANLMNFTRSEKNERDTGKE